MNRLFALLLGGWLALPAYAQMGFQVEPPKIFFDEQPGRPGQIAPVRVKVSNPSPVRMVVRISCLDWQRDSVGDKQFYPAGRLRSSCCPYVRVQPETIELSPNDQQDVVVTLTQPPAGGSPALRHGMLMFTQINEKEIAAAQGIRSGMIFKVQIGVHLYHVPGGVAARAVAIDTMKVEHRQEVRQVRVRVANTGGLHAESLLKVELTNLETGQETSLSDVPVNTLPGERIWANASLPPKMARGRYLIVAILDTGQDVPLQVAEFETNVP